MSMHKYGVLFSVDAAQRTDWLSIQMEQVQTLMGKFKASTNLL